MSRRRAPKQSTMKRRLTKLGFRSYPAYLASPLWAANKERWYREHEKRPQCYVCRKRSQLQLHHTTYARLGSEAAADLVILCNGCHMEVHRQVKARACRLATAHVYVKALRGAGLSGAPPTRVIRAKRRRSPRSRLR